MDLSVTWSQPAVAVSSRFFSHWSGYLLILQDVSGKKYFSYHVLMMTYVRKRKKERKKASKQERKKEKEKKKWSFLCLAKLYCEKCFVVLP